MVRISALAIALLASAPAAAQAPATPAANPNLRTDVAKTLDQNFDKSDVNNDGFLSDEEVRRTAGQVGQQMMSRLDQEFDGLDKDKNGQSARRSSGRSPRREWRKCPTRRAAAGREQGRQGQHRRVQRPCARRIRPYRHQQRGTISRKNGRRLRALAFAKPRPKKPFLGAAFSRGEIGARRDHRTDRRHGGGSGVSNGGVPHAPSLKPTGPIRGSRKINVEGATGSGRDARDRPRAVLGRAAAQCL